MVDKMACKLVGELEHYMVAHSDEAMVGWMAAVSAKMMDAPTVVLKVAMTGALKVEKMD